MHAGWIDATNLVGSEGYMVICKVMSSPTSMREDIYFSLRIHTDLSWKVLLLGQCISTTCPMLLDLPQALFSLLDVEVVLKALDASMICIGNDDAKFSDLAKSHEGTFMDASGKCYLVYIR